MSPDPSELFAALLGDTVRIGNPLFWKTKTMSCTESTNLAVRT